MLVAHRVAGSLCLPLPLPFVRFDGVGQLEQRDLSRRQVADARRPRKAVTVLVELTVVERLLFDWPEVGAAG